MKTVLVLNGPNLGRLGRREPDVYGSTTYEDLVALIESEAKDLGLEAVVRQSDSEAQLISWVHAVRAGRPQCATRELPFRLRLYPWVDAGGKSHRLKSDLIYKSAKALEVPAPFVFPFR